MLSGGFLKFLPAFVLCYYKIYCKNLDKNYFNPTDLFGILLTNLIFQI